MTLILAKWWSVDMTKEINPLLIRQAQKTIGHNGRVAEKKVITRFSARATPGSGNQQGAKGDYSVDSFLIENKATEKESFGLKQDHLLKIYQEALNAGKLPALSFQFITPAGNSQKKDRWVAVPEHVFKQMLEELKGEL